MVESLIEINIYKTNNECVKAMRMASKMRLGFTCAVSMLRFFSRLIMGFILIAFFGDKNIHICLNCSHCLRCCIFNVCLLIAL